MKITAGTIARTIILALALVNQVLTACGISVIPIDDESIQTIVATTFTVVTAVVAWWKNNSFTKKAIAADAYMKSAGADTTDEPVEKEETTETTDETEEL